MNKAFVREPEDAGDRCPACGSTGQRVFAATLEAHLSPESRRQLSDSAYFCPHPTCGVAYFDSLERTVPADSLLCPVYPKDPEAPICPCFGLTVEDIEADVREGGVTRMKAHHAQAQSAEAHCATAAASGQSCIPVVQRCFMRLRGGALG
jgi:hypothetical protein